MILTTGSTKGGVGKTLIACNIASALALGGADVLRIDGDEQSSSAMFAQLRAELELEARAFTTIQLQGAAIRQQIRALGSKYDHVVIDVGGQDSGSLRAALAITETLLIPFLPRSVDLWAGPQMVALVAEARVINEGLRALAVLNCADPIGTDNTDALAALTELQGIDVLEATIGRRKAFPMRFRPVAVLEHRPIDAKATEELIAVINTLYTRRKSVVRLPTTRQQPKEDVA
jgi:chromosome partitioning protein